MNSLKQAVFDTLDSSAKIEAVVARYCRRRIDRLLKKLDLSDGHDVTSIAEVYLQRTSELNIAEIAQEATDRIRLAIREQELSQLLADYDNKELLALAARHLKNQKVTDFKSWLVRVLRSGRSLALDEAIRECLPEIPSPPPSPVEDGGS